MYWVYFEYMTIRCAYYVSKGLKELKIMLPILSFSDCNNYIQHIMRELLKAIQCNTDDQRKRYNRQNYLTGSLLYQEVTVAPGTEVEDDGKQIQSTGKSAGLLKSIFLVYTIVR